LYQCSGGSQFFASQEALSSPDSQTYFLRSVWVSVMTHAKEFACEEFERCCSSHPYIAQVLSIPRKLSKTEDKTLRRGKGRSFYKGTYPAERYCTLMRPEATIT